MKITPEGVEALLSLDEFPDFCQRFYDDVGFHYEGAWRDTAYVEAAGKVFRQHLGDAAKTEQFVLLVTKWGGPTGNRVRGQLTKANSWQTIANAIKDAVHYLDEGDVKSAVMEILSLKGLGISYGSKILRIISPEQAGVFDSQIESICGYDSYSKFCADCKSLADVLDERGIQNPARENGKWLVADVEATIFHCHRLRGFR